MRPPGRHKQLPNRSASGSTAVSASRKPASMLKRTNASTLSRRSASKLNRRGASEQTDFARRRQSAGDAIAWNS